MRRCSLVKAAQETRGFLRAPHYSVSPLQNAAEAAAAAAAAVHTLGVHAAPVLKSSRTQRRIVVIELERSKKGRRARVLLVSPPHRLPLSRLLLSSPPPSSSLSRASLSLTLTSHSPSPLAPIGKRYLSNLMGFLAALLLGSPVLLVASERRRRRPLQGEQRSVAAFGGHGMSCLLCR